jgi:hypothetical protein
LRKGVKITLLICRMMVLLLVMLSAGGCSKKNPLKISFYYFETCPSCNEYTTAERLSENIAILDKRNRDISAVSRNCLNQEYMDELFDELEKLKIDEFIDFPVLLLNDTYIIGYDAISKRIGQLMLESD